MKNLLRHNMASFKDFIKESGLLPSYKVRERLAARYLRGEGLEIGALHLPLRVPAGVVVRYVDLATREENIRMHPEIPGDRIVATDYVENGFDLKVIPDESQDFVIANHVLEHAPNPFQVLLNWGRVLRNSGVLLVTIPLAEFCFDRGRPLTPLQHFIEDYETCRAGRVADFAEANKAHYREWLTISEPAISTSRGIETASCSEGDMVLRIERMASQSAQMHYHTFSVESFEQLLEYFAERISGAFRIAEIKTSRGGRECVAVVVKTAV